MATITGHSILQGDRLDIGPKGLHDILEDTLTNSESHARPAIIYNDRMTTLSQVNKLSEEIKQRILLLLSSTTHPEGISNDTEPLCIGILMSPSEKRMVALAGIIKARFCFVPIEPNLPKGRIKHIMQDTRMGLVVTTSYDVEEFQVGDLLQEVRVRILDYDDIVNVKTMAASVNQNSMLLQHKNATQALDSRRTVCTLYTSGSTGVPKRVDIKEHNLLNRLHWYWKRFPFMKTDVGCQKTSWQFVDGITETLSCMLKGIPMLVLTKEQVLDIGSFLTSLYKHRVSILVLVPSLLETMLSWLPSTSSIVNHCTLVKEMMKMQLHAGNVSPTDTLKSLRLVVSSGERLPEKLVSNFYKQVGDGCTLVNLYGSTEVTGDVTFFVLSPSWQDETINKEIPIGGAVSNCNIYIVDENSKTVPMGEEGEMCISGSNVTRGPDGVQFVDNPFSDKLQHSCLYRTGDYGVIINGKLYYKGRKDSQIKIRGQRVDLHEIERVFETMNFVKKASILAFPSKDEGMVILAFYELRKDTKIRDVDGEIEHILRDTLLLYMYPRLVPVAQIPLLPSSGKTDKRALLDMYKRKLFVKEVKSKDVVAILKPERYGVQRVGVSTLVKATNAVLKYLGCNIDEVDFEQSFFANGGNSLSAIQALSTFRNIGLEIDLKTFINSNNLLQTLCDSILSLKVDDVDTHTEFKIQTITDKSNKTSIIKLLAEGFQQTNPLDVLAGTTLHGAVKMMESFWPNAVKERLSFIVIDNSSGETVGVSIAFNANSKLDGLYFEHRHVADINEEVEAPVKDRLNLKDEKWMDTVFTAVSVEFPESRTLEVLQLLEDEVLRIAREEQFDGIVCVNSHPVTMEMAELMGYTVMNSLHVKTYQWKGKYPFSEADDDYYIKCMIKRIGDCDDYTNTENF